MLTRESTCRHCASETSLHANETVFADHVKMRAALLVAPRTVELIESAVPTLSADEALVRVRACGVCGSDQNAWRGVEGTSYPLPPGAPGHEIDGEVVSLGDRGGVLSIGGRVTGLAQNGYAEMVVARADELLAVPDHVGKAPLLGEPLACAANIVRRAGTAPRVAIVGFGYLAALVAQLGPENVSWVAISQREESRTLALRLGAEAAYGLDDVPASAWESFPLVIEAAGTQRTLDLATWLVATRGRLVIAGYHADGPRTVDVRTWNWKGIDVVNAHERAPEAYLRGLREGLAILDQRRIDLAPLVTHRFPLERLADALGAAERRPPGFVKAVVVP